MASVSVQQHDPPSPVGNGIACRVARRVSCHVVACRVGCLAGDRAMVLVGGDFGVVNIIIVSYCSRFVGCSLNKTKNSKNKNKRITKQRYRWSRAYKEVVRKQRQSGLYCPFSCRIVKAYMLATVDTVCTHEVGDYFVFYVLRTSLMPPFFCGWGRPRCCGTRCERSARRPRASGPRQTAWSSRRATRRSSSSCRRPRPRTWSRSSGNGTSTPRFVFTNSGACTIKIVVIIRFFGVFYGDGTRQETPHCYVPPWI